MREEKLSIERSMKMSKHFKELKNQHNNKSSKIWIYQILSKDNETLIAINHSFNSSYSLPKCKLNSCILDQEHRKGLVLGQAMLMRILKQCSRSDKASTQSYPLNLLLLDPIIHLKEILLIQEYRYTINLKKKQTKNYYTFYSHDGRILSNFFP